MRRTVRSATAAGIVGLWRRLFGWWFVQGTYDTSGWWFCSRKVFITSGFGGSLGLRKIIPIGCSPRELTTLPVGGFAQGGFLSLLVGGFVQGWFWSLPIGGSLKKSKTIPVDGSPEERTTLPVGGSLKKGFDTSRCWFAHGKCDTSGWWFDWRRYKTFG